MNIYDLILEIDYAKSALELRRIRKKVVRACPENLQAVNVAIDQQFALLNSAEVNQIPRWK
jgi:hypothetical protein